MNKLKYLGLLMIFVVICQAEELAWLSRKITNNTKYAVDVVLTYKNDCSKAKVKCEPVVSYKLIVKPKETITFSDVIKAQFGKPSFSSSKLINHFSVGEHVFPPNKFSNFFLAQIRDPKDKDYSITMKGIDDPEFVVE